MSESTSIEFVYPKGKKSELDREHREGFKSTESFDAESVTVTGSYIVFRSGSYTDVYDRHAFPNQYNKPTHESESDTIDLREYPLISYYLSDSSVLSAENMPDEKNSPLKELVEMIKIAYAATGDSPVAAYSMTPDMPHIGRPPFTAKSLANDEFTHMCWLMIFTPNFVRTYGRETLLSAPAWHVEELDDGAVMIVCHDDLSWKTSIDAVADHIGLPSYESFWGSPWK
jgi:hypothetical protein